MSLYFHEFLGKIKEHEGKQYLTVDDYTVDKVLVKNQEIISIEKFDDTRILIDAGDKLSDETTF